MKSSVPLAIYALFPAASILFLIVEHLTHMEFFLHLAAIPMEVLVAVLIVERFLEKKEKQEKRRQLMLIKSYMFRSDMRSLFIEEAEKNEGMMLKVRKVLWDGIQRFMDYTIELKEKQPEMFADVLSDYDLSSRFMNSSRKESA